MHCCAARPSSRDALRGSGGAPGGAALLRHWRGGTRRKRSRAGLASPPGGLVSPPAPPGAPSPHFEGRKKGHRRARAAKNRAGGALPGRTAMKFGIGQPITRKEDEALLRGAGRYVADHAPAGLLHAVVLRSPHAHARFRITDVETARGMRGVALVLTGVDTQELGNLPCQGAIPDVTSA